MGQFETTNGLESRGILGKLKLYFLRHPRPPLEDRMRYDLEFANSTSFHGLHNLVGKRSKVHKLLWMTVVFASVLIVSWQICTRIVNYFSWPTTTSVTVQYVENIEFPAVTFCNLNRFQSQAVANLSIIFFLWSFVSAVLHITVSEDNSKIAQEIAEFLQLNQNFSIKEFTRNNGFYLDNTTLMRCEFFGKPCYPEDFDHVFTEYGNCFTFNHDGVPAKKKVSLSGRGLSLLFDIKQSEFTDDASLGFIDAGITFVVHSPKEPPQFDGLGLATPIGMHAHASIRQFKTITQEYPWGECNPNLKLNYHRVYTSYGCIQECKARYIIKHCGCLPFLLPGNGTECDLERQYNCVTPALNDIEMMGLCSVGRHNSTCPVPCEETDYPTTVTYSTFASTSALKFLSNKLKRSMEYISSPLDGWKSIGKLHVESHLRISRNNYVHIDIRYHDLNYKMTQQQKALTSTELLADVGGQLGLFCGASMITVIEILEYIFTNLYWLCIFFLMKTADKPQMSSTAKHQLHQKNKIQAC